MAAPPVVAILNSNDDVVEMLRIVIEQAGLIAVSGQIDKIRRGEMSLPDLVEEHDPQVIIYDLVPPYDRSWRFLDHLRGAARMTGRKFIITTTNAQRVREIIGDAEHVYEIVGKPFDIHQIADAVLSATGRKSDLPENARRV
jgi:DNA-binding NarL/FixJ family response regulator